MNDSSANKRPPEGRLLVTAGDPAGIGPELVEKAVPLIVESGVSAWIFQTGTKTRHERLLKAFASHNVSVHSGPVLNPGSKARICITTLEEDPLFTDWLKRGGQGLLGEGRPGPGSGFLAYLALKRACAAAAVEKPLGLLTAPLAKGWVAEATGGHFSGHTEYLSEAFGCGVVMVMRAPETSVIPLTIHVPLSEVPARLRGVMADKGTLDVLLSLHRSGLYPGPWAVCGLNPHAGENGRLGSEENDFMADRVRLWKERGLPVEGPLPADAVFQPDLRQRYSLILAAYHDQGLVPFKALVGRRGINFTWGLPFFRASPDHGTAFDLAGRETADPTSMLEALRFLLSPGARAAASGEDHAA